MFTHKFYLNKWTHTYEWKFWFVKDSVSNINLLFEQYEWEKFQPFVLWGKNYFSFICDNLLYYFYSSQDVIVLDNQKTASAIIKGTYVNTTFYPKCNIYHMFFLLPSSQEVIVLDNQKTASAITLGNKIKLFFCNIYENG